MYAKPKHVRGRSRRGSFLVLVVGILALVALVTILYVSIGRSDRQTAVSAAAAGQVNNVPVAVRDTVAKVIADDLFQGRPISSALNAPLARKTSVYPWSDGATRIVPQNANQPRYRVNGQGGDTPWLSSSIPSVLDFGLSSAQANYGAAPAFNWMRDWSHMGVWSPDGAVVNLSNIRPLAAGGRGFDADEVDVRRNLWVYSPAGVPQLVNPASQAFNSPATWARNQYAAALRRVDDPVLASGVPTPASNPFLLDYRYADADGDGMMDAPWIELYDRLTGRRLVENEPNLRWFFAIRAIDLSSMANVNTAAEVRLSGVVPAGQPQLFPHNFAPLGTTPADIDLHRLLRMHDAHREYYVLNTDAQTVGRGMGFIPQPTRAPTNEPDNYWEYTWQESAEVFGVGQMSYSALRYALGLGPVPARNASLDLRNIDSAERRARYYTFGQPGGVGFDSSGFQPRGVGGIDDLLELLTYHGVNNPAVTSRLEAAVGNRSDPATDPFRRFSPLRDNRSLALERSETAPLTQVRALQAFDRRRLLTTVSSSRPIRPLATDADGLEKLASSDLKINLIPAMARGEWSTIFNGLCDALMAPIGPDYVGAWRPSGDTRFLESRTLFYGQRGPEFAMRIAGAMTANLRSSYSNDPEFTPKRLTILFDEDQYTPLFVTLAGQQPSARQPLLRGLALGAAERLDANRGQRVGNAAVPKAKSRLAHTSAGDSPRDLGASGNPAEAITFFGVEPQPVLTEVAAFFMYTDKPTTLGGDDEGDQPITIHDGLYDGSGGGSATPEADHLFHCLVFQVTNPFWFDITLYDPNRPNVRYYAELGDELPALNGSTRGRYLLATVDAAGNPQLTELKAGQTRNFYVLSNSVQNIESTIRQLPGASTFTLGSWLDAQLTVTNNVTRDFQQSSSGVPPAASANPIAPARVARFDPSQGQTQVFTSPTKLLASGTSTNFARNREARLWRMVLDDGETPSNNLTENDQLLDRIRDSVDPGTTPGGSLLRFIDLPSDEVNGTQGATGSGPGSQVRDDTGYTLVLATSFRRPNLANTGPSSALSHDRQAQTPQGGVPAYAIEVRPGATDGNGQRLSLNKVEYEFGAGAAGKRSSLARADFQPAGTSVARTTFAAAWNAQLANALIPTLKLRAEARSGNTIQIPGLGSERNQSGVAFRDLALMLAPNKNEFKVSYQWPGTTSAQVYSTFRVGDLLLTPAIAPFYDPSEIPAGGEVADGWYTLPEVLAMALDFDNSHENGARSGEDILFGLGGADSLSSLRGPLKYGYLQLDRYVPFVNRSAPGQAPEYVEFDPNTDEARFPQAPMAATIFDHFAAFDREGAYSLTQGVQGQVNVNTAGVEMLRMIPGWAPDSIAPGDGPNPNPISWQGVPSGGANSVTHTSASDIAASVFAMRDKTATWTRASRPQNATGTGNATISFRDTSGTLVDGRTAASGVLGVREEPGLAFQGELALARRFNPVGGGPTNTHDIDRLATGATPGWLSERGVGGFFSTTPPGTPTGQGKFANFYGRGSQHGRIALMNSAAATTTVRSDTFAVWFVVRGYRRGEVEALLPADVMVPAIERRFVMVVDRSNVVKKGDMPRILLFKEVPL